MYKKGTAATLPHPMNIIVRLRRSFQPSSSFTYLQETLFGRTVTPAERLRQHQRSLTKAQRELDRERAKLEQSEKKLIMDIKKSAKAGQLVSLLVYDHHTVPCLDSPPERLQGHGKRSSQNTEICPEVLSNAHSAAGSRAAHTDAEEQSTDGRRYAWRNTRVCPSLFNSQLLIYPSIGDGFNESRPQSPRHPTNYE